MCEKSALIRDIITVEIFIRTFMFRHVTRLCGSKRNVWSLSRLWQTDMLNWICKQLQLFSVVLRKVKISWNHSDYVTEWFCEGYHHFNRTIAIITGFFLMTQFIFFYASIIGRLSACGTECLKKYSLPSFEILLAV